LKKQKIPMEKKTLAKKTLTNSEMVLKRILNNPECVHICIYIYKNSRKNGCTDGCSGIEEIGKLLSEKQKKYCRAER